MDSTTQTILVVDDSLENIQVISGMLEYLGCEVLIATNGAQAVEIATKARPTAVILDVTMPQMDGFEVCQALRTDPTTVQVPVYLLSGHDGLEVKARGRDVGATGYLTKPILLEDLEKVVARLPGGPPRDEDGS